MRNPAKSMYSMKQFWLVEQKKHKLRDHPGMVFAQPHLLDRIESPMRQLSRSSVCECEPILHPFPPSLRHRLSTGELPAIPSHHPIIFILLIRSRKWQVRLHLCLHPTNHCSLAAEVIVWSCWQSSGFLVQGMELDIQANS